MMEMVLSVVIMMVSLSTGLTNKVLKGGGAYDQVNAQLCRKEKNR